MKRSLFFYYFNLVTSVILAVCSFFISNYHASVYDAASPLEPLTGSIIEEKKNTAPKISSTYQPASAPVTFSTGNVVKSTITTFSAPIIEVKDMNYTDYSGYNHLNDAYSIMHYGVSGSNFYYGHNTGGLAPLSSLSEGQEFYVGGVKYRVAAIEYLTFADTATNMRRIISSNDHIYGATFMTCAGSMGYYQNNSGRVDYTASHRLIVHANRA